MEESLLRILKVRGSNPRVEKQEADKGGNSDVAMATRMMQPKGYEEGDMGGAYLAPRNCPEGKQGIMGFFQLSNLTCQQDYTFTSSKHSYS